MSVIKSLLYHSLMIDASHDLNKCKYKFVILESRGIIAINSREKGQSSIPADILVDI